jgi:Tfp pilus assembly protein FimT
MYQGFTGNTLIDLLIFIVILLFLLVIAFKLLGKL